MLQRKGKKKGGNKKKGKAKEKKPKKVKDPKKSVDEERRLQLLTLAKSLKKKLKTETSDFNRFQTQRDQLNYFGFSRERISRTRKARDVTRTERSKTWRRNIKSISNCTSNL